MPVKITSTNTEIIFRREPAQICCTDGAVVRVSSSAHEALKLWSNKTGLPVAKLASEFILFAAERSRLEFSDERT